MKRFLINITYFLIICALVLTIVSEGVLLKRNYLSMNLSFSHILDRVYRSESKMPSDTLYLGDSVAEQFFSFYENKNSLTINGAVLLSGQYILLKNSLRKNPQITNVYLILNPTSLKQSFSNPRTYNNFVKPFFNFKNINNINPLIFKKLKSKPYSMLSFLSLFKVLPISDIMFNEDGKENLSLFSDVNFEYFQMIFHLCKNNNVSLSLISTPVSCKNQNLIDGFFNDLNEDEQQFMEILNKYKKSIIYLEDFCFIDDLHLTSETLSRKKYLYKSLILNFE